MVWNKGLHLNTRDGGIKPIVDNCTCSTCSRPFHARQSQIDRSKSKYCSRKCYMVRRSLWMKDKNLNPMYRVNFKKEKNPNWRGGNNCIDCNIAILRQFVRCSKCNYKFYSGERHHLWRGGNDLYPLGWNRTFKEQIRRRDQYKCQTCGVPEAECKTRLPVHHIDYDKFNLQPDNLITLCNSCHAKTNFRREYWFQYFRKDVIPYAPKSYY